MKNHQLFIIVILVFIMTVTVFFLGLHMYEKIFKESYNTHDNSEIKPHVTKYFSDPETIDLCCFIYSRNIGEIDQLLKTKNVCNTQGKCNVTPLYYLFQGISAWSYSATKDYSKNKSYCDESKKRDVEKELCVMYRKEYIRIFERLLFYGADPNVQINMDEKQTFPDRLFPDYETGVSLTFLSAAQYLSNLDESEGIDIFPMVMKYGGDPNTIYTYYHVTPIFAACNPGIRFGEGNGGKGGYIGDTSSASGPCNPSPRNVGLLIDSGADIEHRDKWRNTPLIAAAGGRNFDIVLMLLEAGADYTAQNEDGENLVYFLCQAKQYDQETEDNPYFTKVVSWLKNKNYPRVNDIEKISKVSNISNPLYQRTFPRKHDPYADEWIEKRKEKRQ